MNSQTAVIAFAPVGECEGSAFGLFVCLSAHVNKKTIVQIYLFFYTTNVYPWLARSSSKNRIGIY